MFIIFDCLIVGAGPAGATAAYHLAKRGRSVLVLDKASLPRYKPCGGGVSPAIKQWFDFDFTPVIDNTVTQVQYTWKLGDPVQTELKMVEPIWMVKRDSFDHFLCQQAQQKGALLKDNTEVQGITAKSDHWEVNTSNETFLAKYLIAADGVNGPMSTWLGFTPRPEANGAILEIKTPISPEKLSIAYFDFGSLKNGYIWTFPKTDGYTISGGCFRGKLKSEDLKKQLFNYATQFGLDPQYAYYAEYPLSLWTSHQPLHTQKAVLAGEAAGILDPLIGEGIRPAILTGFQAAIAIDQALAGQSNSLANYTQVISQEWGTEMALAQKLAGLFYQFTPIAYKVAVKRPTAAQIMGKILCGEIKYSDVTEQALQRLKKRLIPGFGGNKNA